MYGRGITILTISNKIKIRTMKNKNNWQAKAINFLKGNTNAPIAIIKQYVALYWPGDLPDDDQIAIFEMYQDSKIKLEYS